MDYNRLNFTLRMVPLSMSINGDLRRMCLVGDSSNIHGMANGPTAMTPSLKP